jgi:hypothetical protein
VRSPRTARLLLIALLLPSSRAPAQNLLVNAEFDQDIAGWSCQQAGAACAWSSDDAEGDPGSGSGQVTREGAGSFRGEIVQCVDLPSAGSYRVGATLRTISDNGRNGQLDVVWFDEAGCGGVQLHQDIIDAVPAALGWTPLDDVLLAPDGAASLELTVIAFAMETESQTVQVDAAFVPEPASPIAGLAAGAALSGLGARRSPLRRRALAHEAPAFPPASHV